MSDTLERVDYRALLKQAYLSLEKMQSKLNALERDKTEPIAIIGVGCRFPGKANNPEAFWQLLHNGADTITEIPSQRWDVNAYYDPNPDALGKMYTRQGSFLSTVDEFDPQFFGITPREAVSMDPQQRLLLEVSWEALENAGLVPHQLMGSQTGVFVGIMTNDYSQLLMKSSDLADLDVYYGTGNDFSFAAGRLSYIFGFHGPSIALNTVCSSSLVTVHLACQSLRANECHLALAGGVNMILSPEMSVILSKMLALAPDGRCKTFDASADGYTRGEGCGMVVLKRLSDAMADGDNILALIRGSAVNHDGPSGGLTVPNGPAQQALIRQALANAGVKPAQIDYVEAHGTGTSLGDPIEVNALAAVLGEGRTADRPLVIGSVKTNIGHLESAAGIAGLIKVVLALQHQEIPPHLHLQKPNPYIPWEQLPVVIPRKQTPWLSGEKHRYAGISSFGLSGINAHVIVEEAPKKNVEPREIERPLHVLCCSAKNQTALQELAIRYAQYLKAQPSTALGDICFTTNTGRSQFSHRLAIASESTSELSQKLTAFATGQPQMGVHTGVLNSTHQPKIAFLFTGQGSQYVGMGRQLYDSQPTFRNTLNQCDEFLRPYLKEPLLSVLYPEGDRISLLDQTAYTQPALFALEYALAQLWRSWGIEPSVVMGHSVGEYVAACVAGVFSLKDGLKLVAERGRLLQALPQNGKMVAVFADAARVAQAIAPYVDTVAIAAWNAPDNTVISGETAAVEEIVATLAKQGISYHYLSVSHAFHSPLTDPMLDAFEQIAQTIDYHPPQIGLVSNVTGEFIGAQVAQAQYWRQHIRQTVRFSSAIKTLEQQGYQLFIEVGPTPILSGLRQRCLPENTEQLWLPSLRRGQKDWQQLLDSLAMLYVRGVRINWSRFDQNYQRFRVPLPTYPFQRQRYWFETPVSDLQELNEKAPQHKTQVETSKLKSNRMLDVIFAEVPQKRQQWLEAYLQQQTSKFLRLAQSEINVHQPLINLGIDSFISVEIKNQIQADLGVNISVVTFLEGTSLSQLACQILTQLTEPFLPSPTASILLPKENDSEHSHQELANNSWFVFPKPNPQAKMRLFCFPYAGGGAQVFHSWTEELSATIELCSVQLPGRGTRLKEAPFTHILPLVTSLASVLVPYLDKPFAFFGHSMGAIIMFEVARQLRREYGLEPNHIFASAAVAPHLYCPPFIHMQPEAKLIDLLRLINFTSTSVLVEDREIRHLMLPTVRADFEIAETYPQAYIEEHPLNSPITAFGAWEDLFASPQGVEAWCKHTTSAFSLFIRPGDHYFLEPDRPFLLQTITQALNDYIHPIHQDTNHKPSFSSSTTSPIVAKEIPQLLIYDSKHSHQELANNSWFVFPKPNPQAKMRLFCFPYAGGGAQVFHSWTEELSATIELCSVQLPGRGTRLKEAPFTHILPLVTSLASVLVPYLDKPFAFFGHSMGAIIMFEVARQLRREYGLESNHIFASAAVAPHLYCPPLVHKQTDANLIDLLRLINFTPAKVLTKEQEMRQLIPLSTVRADFEVAASYTYIAESPLDSPITAFGAWQDIWTSPIGIQAWQQHTSATFSVFMRSGDHYFLESERSFLLKTISQNFSGTLQNT